MQEAALAKKYKHTGKICFVLTIIAALGMIVANHVTPQDPVCSEAGKKDTAQTNTTGNIMAIASGVAFHALLEKLRTFIFTSLLSPFYALVRSFHPLT